MTASRILYFTAGETPTVDEAAEIAGLNAVAAPKYEVLVRRGDSIPSATNNNYGHGPEACDFVAGTPPTAYNASPVFDPDSEPTTVGPGDTIAVHNSAASKTVNGTADIVDDAVVVALAATEAIVSDTNTVVVHNSADSVTKNGTAHVALGVISKVNLAATEAIVSNTGAVAVVDSAGTSEAAGVAAVASGLVTNVALPTTDKIIKSTVQVPCPAPSGTRTTGYVFTIVNGVITAAVGY